jgi:hypothetical protein
LASKLSWKSLQECTIGCQSWLFREDTKNLLNICRHSILHGS